MKEVAIYTDGCALGNPGSGGAGAVLIYGEVKKEFRWSLGKTTNNRAELQAGIFALRALKSACSVTIFSDSQVTVRCANGEYKASSNIDLWSQYEQAAKNHNVSWVWIKKDSHELNHRAHLLANEAAVAQNVS